MIRIGLIGCLTQVTPYFDLFAGIPELIFSGYYSISEEECNKNFKNPEIKKINKFEDLLQISDALYFVQEDKRCLKLSQFALKASKHVFIKPSIIENKSQSNQLTKLANEARVVLMTGSPVKYHAALNAVLPQLKNIRLIEIQKHLSVKENHTLENILMALLQDIDIINTVLKSNLKNIKTTGVRMMNRNPDIVNVRLEYDNGCVANLNSSWVENEERHIGLFTQQDRITKVNFLDNEIVVLKPEKNNKAEGGFALKPMVKKIETNNPFYDEALNFINTIKNNSKLISNPEDSFKSLIIAEKIMDNLNKVLAN